MAKKKQEKFYNISFGEQKNEIFLYGEIVSGTDKWDESDITFTDFRDALDTINDNSTLDIFVNSPGGSVATSQGIVAMLQRAKTRGVTVNAYLDGICASCASWIPMVADNIYVYEQSILMVHKPLCMTYGNANDMQKQIDILDTIENDVIIPLYLEKAKDGITKEMIQDMMAKETWMGSQEIQDKFNVTPLKSSKQITACVDKDLMKNYINIPDNIKDLLNEKEDKDLEDNKIDETIVENADEEVKVDETIVEDEVVENSDEEIKVDEAVVENADEETIIEDSDDEVEDKLKKSNEKVIALNDKVQELTSLVEAMQPIVNEYNNKKAEELRIEQEAKIEATTNLYKNKFAKVGALDKFESKEVQDLIKDSNTNEENLSKLNSMLVDLINVDDSIKTFKMVSEQGTLVNNLIPKSEDDGLSSYFED